jgi:hypothetical protein
MNGAIPPLPNTPSWRGAQLKHRDNFTFTTTMTWRPWGIRVQTGHKQNHLGAKWHKHKFDIIYIYIYICVCVCVCVYGGDKGKFVAVISLLSTPPWRCIGEVEVQLHSALDGAEWSAPPGKSPGTHYTGGWMGPRDGLDAAIRRKIPSTCRDSNPDNPARSPALYHWAILAPSYGGGGDIVDWNFWHGN